MKRTIARAVFLVACTSAPAQEADFYLLKSDHLRCVVDHLSAYGALGDPVFIDTTKCPPEGKPTGLLGALVNEMAAPEFADGTDTFLALSPADLTCLGKVDLPANTGTLRFYPAECRIEPGS